MRGGGMAGRICSACAAGDTASVMARGGHVQVDRR